MSGIPGALAKIAWYVSWLLAVLLTVRFVLKLLGADPASRFADVIYQISFPLLVPFAGILPAWHFGPLTIEPPALIGAIGYLMIGTAVAKFFELFIDDPDPGLPVRTR